MGTADWKAIASCYLLVLLFALLALVIVGLVFSWRRHPHNKPHPPIDNGVVAPHTETDVQQQQRLQQQDLPPVPLPRSEAELPVQYLDEIEDDQAQAQAQQAQAAALIQPQPEAVKETYPVPVEAAAVVLPTIASDVKPVPGSLFAFPPYASQHNYKHPGYIITYHKDCANIAQAFQSLCTRFGADITSNATTHFNIQSGFHFRGFHVRELNSSLQQELLLHPAIGDIHEDGYAMLNLPARSDVKDEQNKLRMLSNKQMVPWSVVRVGGKSSSLKIGTAKERSYDNVAVFVLDTGVDVDHPDLNVGMWKRNFVNIKDVADELDVRDQNGHGTHVAGIIGAKDNGFGSVGTSPGIPIHPVKVLDGSGAGQLSVILQGLAYCVHIQKQHPQTRCLANISFGTKGKCTLLDHAVTAASEQMTIVMAAGNDHLDVNECSPARMALHSRAISVGAFTARNSYSSYSNFGDGVTTLAPGDDILSTYKDRGYAYLTGTSMASPCVTGVLAAYLSTVPVEERSRESPEGLKQKLIAWSTKANMRANPVVSMRPSAYTCNRSVFMEF